MERKNVFRFGIVFASFVALATMAAQAQPRGFGHHGNQTPEERIDRRVGFLDEKLDLSDAQITSIRGVLENARAEAEAWHKDHQEASRDDRRVFREEHQAATEASILDVLTEDQKATFKSLQDLPGAHGPGMREMGAHMRHGRDRGMWRGGRPEGMRDTPMRSGELMMGRFLHELNLSDDQKEQLLAMRDDRRAEMDAWNDAHPEATWQERLEFRRDQLDASLTAIGDVLTPDQNAKLNELSARHTERRLGRRGWGRGAEMLMRRLDLTKDQETQLEKLRAEHMAAAEAWHKEHPNATADERRAFREAHREEMKEGLKNVLTEEQIGKLESLRDRHHGEEGFGRRWDHPHVERPNEK